MDDATHDRVSWVVVCPDGRVRHDPFSDQEAADAEAEACSKDLRCHWAADEAAGQPPCPGGVHAVRRQISMPPPPTGRTWPAT